MMLKLHDWQTDTQRRMREVQENAKIVVIGNWEIMNL